MELSADDKIEIQELLARFNRHADAGEADEWADTFVDDGEFETMLMGTYRGREELRSFLIAFHTNPRYTAYAGGQHWAGNIIIEGSGDEATVFAYHQMTMPRAEGVVESIVMAAHEDEVVRTEVGWRFRRRRVVPWPPGSDPQTWNRQPDT